MRATLPLNPVGKEDIVVRRFWIITSLLLVLWQSPAMAGPDVADPVIARVEAEGYSVSDVSKTWLGRILITAEDDQNLREIVLNRTTGEILRDRLFPRAASASGSEPQSKNGSGRPSNAPSGPDAPNGPSGPSSPNGPSGPSGPDGPS